MAFTRPAAGDTFHWGDWDKGGEEPASSPLTTYGDRSEYPSLGDTPLTDRDIKQMIELPVPEIGRLDVPMFSDGKIKKAAGKLFLYYASRLLTGSAYHRTYFESLCFEQSLGQSAHNWLLQEGLIIDNPRKYPIALGALKRVGEVFCQTFTDRDQHALAMLQNETKKYAGQIFLHYYSHIARGEAYSRVYFTDSLDSVKQQGYQHSHDWLVAEGLISQDPLHPIREGALRKAIDIFYPSLYTDEQVEILLELSRTL